MTATPRPTSTRRASSTPRPRATATPIRNRCDPSYPDVCIPPPPPDLNCDDVPQLSNFRVIGGDPYNFDSNNDGRGCEGN